MKANILDTKGKKIKEIVLPKCFSEKIREDIVAKVLEIKKTWQPYGPSPIAGKQYSARGKIKHRRHIWQTHYGRGMSRIPRKVMSRRGSQFRWEGAAIPGAKGGMRAHPPKPTSMINVKKVNKKELKIAFYSAISATASKEFLAKKYLGIEKKDIKEIPLIIDSNISELKVKELLKTLKEILGEKVYKIAIKKKSIRAGKGKLRGRKYKNTAGLLLVKGKEEKIKTNAFDIVEAENLGVEDVAKGGLGRLTLYTENAIKDLGERFK